MRFFRAAEFLLLYCHEHIIRNNGLMGVGREIPVHEAIVFNLNCSSADGFLKQHPFGVFFIGEQFVNRFPVPFGPAGGGGDALPFQPGSNFPQTITGKIPFKYPAHYFGFVWIYLQFSVRIDCVSIALAFCHFRAAALKPFPETVLNGFTSEMTAA